MEYRIQQIQFKQKTTHRILQNVGGPCPLIGLCNVLLLNNDIRVNKTVKSIKFKDLTFCLDDHLQKLFEVNFGSKKNVNREAMANAIQNISDCVALFPKLEDGLDVNIKFDDVFSFEFTPAIAMFDAYNVRIVHGWVIDPQNKELFNIIGHLSYNEVVNFLTTDLINDSTLSDDEKCTIQSQRILIQNFLSQFSQQLTSYGLIRMHEIINENETCIFFRNNHFSTIHKHNQRLYELVSDEGFIDADPKITWQTLSELSGDSQFTFNNFAVIAEANVKQKNAMNHYKHNVKNNQQKNNQNQNQNENRNQSQNQQNNQNPQSNNNSNNSGGSNSNAYVEQQAFLDKQYQESNARLNNNNNHNEKNKNTVDLNAAMNNLHVHNNDNDANNDTNNDNHGGNDVSIADPPIDNNSGGGGNHNNYYDSAAVNNDAILAAEIGIEQSNLQSLQAEQQKAFEQFQQNKQNQQNRQHQQYQPQQQNRYQQNPNTYQYQQYQQQQQQYNHGGNNGYYANNQAQAQAQPQRRQRSAKKKKSDSSCIIC